MKTAVKVISYIVIVALLLGAVGAIWFFTDGGNEDLKTFMLFCDGDVVVNEKTYLRLEQGDAHEMRVKYMLDAPTGDARGYTVRVTPNPEADFTFVAGERRMSWSGMGEMTEYFVSEQTDDGFTLKCDVGTVQEFLQSLFPEEPVEIMAFVESTYLLRLTVTSYNEKVTYTINFSLPDPQFKISREVVSDGSRPLNYDGPEIAHMGDKVTFFAVADTPYSIVSVVLRVAGEDDAVVQRVGGVYSHEYTFTMSRADVTLVFTLQNMSA